MYIKYTLMAEALRTLTWVHKYSAITTFSCSARTRTVFHCVKSTVLVVPLKTFEIINISLSYHPHQYHHNTRVHSMNVQTEWMKWDTIHYGVRMWHMNCVCVCVCVGGRHTYACGLKAFDLWLYKIQIQKL